MKLFDRLFRRSKPSAPSATAPTGDPTDALMDVLVKQGLVAPGMKGQVVLVRHNSDGSTTERHVGPTMPEHVARVTDSWNNWSEVMSHIVEPHPGWVPCKFGIRNAYDPKLVVFPIGIARGMFGVWTCDMRVCNEHRDHAEEGQATLATLSHLATGINLCLFADRKLACEAAEVLSGQAGSAIPWHRMDEREVFETSGETAATILRFNGFELEQDRHAHGGPDDDPHTIWAKAHPETPTKKPESLS